MVDLTNILGGAWEATRIDPPDVQLREAILNAGLLPPEDLLIDGKLHRFRSGTKGKPGHGDKPGWYLVFPDGIPAGRFGCWRAGIEVTFRADIGRTLSAEEEQAHARRLGEAQYLRDAELDRKRQAAREMVEKIWVDAGRADPEHPYLKRKGIHTHGARTQGDGRIIVPLYDINGNISTLQYIDQAGGKLYHPGGKTGGMFWMLGTLDEPGVLFMAEGFATAATLHEVTHRPVIVAYSASNLVPVTGLLREKYGTTQEIVIVADNDESGIGQKYADQASAKFGAQVILIPERGDANDYFQSGNNLMALLMPEVGAAILKKLKVIFGDEIGEDYEAPDELVEGLMTIGSSTVVYGDSNSGKTFWALSVATAISMGSLCYGRKTDQGLVIYLASEAPESIRSRMQAIKKYYGCTLENLAMVPIPMNFYTNNNDANDVIELVKSIEQIKGKPVRLIIGDTLSRMSAGANENSGEDMGPVMARFELVAKSSNAAIMIIHHNGKDSAKGSRGWSGIRAHIDTEIEVIEKDGLRFIRVTKQRELPSKGEDIYFKLEIIEMGISKFGSTVSTCVAIPDESEKIRPDKKDSKLSEFKKIIDNAWWDSGAEVRETLPYISRSGLKDYFEKMGISGRTIENKLCAGRSGGLVNSLIIGCVIKPLENGWVVIDEILGSVLIIRKQNQ